MDDGRRAGLLRVDLGDLLFGCSEAGLEYFDLPEPSFPLRLGNAVDEVVADFLKSGSFVRVYPEKRASDARFSETNLASIV